MLYHLYFFEFIFRDFTFGIAFFDDVDGGSGVFFLVEKFNPLNDNPYDTACKE